MTDDAFKEDVIARLDRIEKLIAAKTSAPAMKSVAGEVADDADLDGKYGDEELRRMPSAKYWPGDDFTGRRMSETTTEFLDAYAKYKDACAYANEKEGNAEKAKYIGYDRKSARRARGWAKRLRDGFKASTPAPKSFADDDGAPF